MPANNLDIALPLTEDKERAKLADMIDDSEQAHSPGKHARINAALDALDRSYQGRPDYARPDESDDSDRNSDEARPSAPLAGPKRRRKVRASLEFGLVTIA